MVVQRTLENENTAIRREHEPLLRSLRALEHECVLCEEKAAGLGSRLATQQQTLEDVRLERDTALTREALCRQDCQQLETRYS